MIERPGFAYPELSALVGPIVPDLRGLFLRGYGSQAYAQNNGTTVGVTSTMHSSGQLGLVQGDATRDVRTSGVMTDVDYPPLGAIAKIPGMIWSYASGQYRLQLADFSSSRVVPVSTENRPVNVAVRYLVRALP